MLLLKDLPKYETLLNHAQRYPHVDAKGTEAMLVMLRTASDILKTFTDHLDDFRMSQGRFTVLVLLNRDPSKPLTPAELADRAGVTRATMTGLLDGLEDEGLITRTGQLEDRRRISVNLTPKAHALLNAMMPDYFRRVATVMRDLQGDERDRLIELMHKLGSGLERLSREDSDRIIPAAIAASHATAAQQPSMGDGAHI